MVHDRACGGASLEKNIFDSGICNFICNMVKTVTKVMMRSPLKPVWAAGQCPKVRWQKCPRCQERIKAEGLRDEYHLQSWFISRIAKFLYARKKHMIGWDEILEGGIPHDAVVMSWRVSPPINMPTPAYATLAACMGSLVCRACMMLLSCPARLVLP